jgi:hypothetical protein
MLAMRLTVASVTVRRVTVVPVSKVWQWLTIEWCVTCVSIDELACSR